MPPTSEDPVDRQRQMASIREKALPERAPCSPKAICLQHKPPIKSGPLRSNSNNRRPNDERRLDAARPRGHDDNLAIGPRSLNERAERHHPSGLRADQRPLAGQSASRQDGRKDDASPPAHFVPRTSLELIIVSPGASGIVTFLP